ncbi:MAG: rubrerythrin [Armatimonadetes bacterium]|nr:rubrerythrin [Armatimonadota bacterium]
MDKKTKDIVAGLIKAYNMELETVINYLSNSVMLDGVRAEEIKKALAADIAAELGHAQRLGSRIKELDGALPGSQGLNWEQESLQPPADTTDVVAVIKGVIEAEEGAIEHYKKLIKLCDDVDWVTQDLMIQLLADEEGHRREFRGFLKEYEK